MERAEWKSFYQWLDTANIDELRSRHQKLVGLLEMLVDLGVRNDVKRMLRDIEGMLLVSDDS
ncbi:MAG TPA: hypothetical protein EYP51_05190 [Thiotrichales bacterium]|nr:hypothetical protein [Thiotrichales bacterium]